MTAHSYRIDFAQVKIGCFRNRVIYRTCYTYNFV